MGTDMVWAKVEVEMIAEMSKVAVFMEDVRFSGSGIWIGFDQREAWLGCVVWQLGMLKFDFFDRRKPVANFLRIHSPEARVSRTISTRAFFEETFFFNTMPAA